MPNQSCYCPEIGQRVGLRNNGPVFNTRFNQWEECIIDGLNKNRFPEYEYPDGKKFLAECRDHEKRFAREIVAPNMIVIVHPFYASLSSYHHLTQRQADDVEQYTSNLLTLLDANLDRNKVGIMALETTYHYTALTSSLLETGKLDRVIFTENNRGNLLNEGELLPFVEKQIYLCGGYNDYCLYQAGKTINAYSKNSNHKVITDLVLNDPNQESMPISPNKARARRELSVGFNATEEALTTTQEVIKQFS